MLTLNDLRKIEATFIEVFRGLFHPRIDYAKAIQAPGAPKAEPTNGNGTPGKRLEPDPENAKAASPAGLDSALTDGASGKDGLARPVAAPPDLNEAASADGAERLETADSAAMIMEDDEPLFEVPPLPKRNGHKTPRAADKGKRPEEVDASS